MSHDIHRIIGELEGCLMVVVQSAGGIAEVNADGVENILTRAKDALLFVAVENRKLVEEVANLSKRINEYSDAYNKSIDEYAKLREQIECKERVPDDQR